MTETRDRVISDDIAELVANAGLGHIQTVEVLPRGGNNQAFRVTTTTHPILVKRYFSHASDMRDRLATEFLFSTYASAVAPGSAPRPIARSNANRLAAYEFIEGTQLCAGDVTSADVEAAIAFFLALNTPSARANAHHLPLASEAVFSLSRHIELIRRRLDHLVEADASHGSDVKAAPFLRLLVADWHRLVDRVSGLAARWSLSMDADLPTEQRCLSPSDFGYHNVLRRGDGQIVFLDFEYAGWDDPTRMLGDFFAQPAVPVPLDFREQFQQRCLQGLGAPPELGLRAMLMRPLYLVKWCCIALGVFVPVILERRRFANSTFDETALKRRQLAIATLLHDQLRKVSDELH